VTVLTVQDVGVVALASVFEPYGIAVRLQDDRQSIPGSYWGESEAGLIGASLLVRADTPIHSAFHEGCHFICMDEARRDSLERDAGGDDAEECGVCYLQIVLANGLRGLSRYRMCADMDEWGYTFRLGSAKRWFEQDAQDGLEWLQRHGVLDAREVPTGRCRA
jgi:hypothetical protein